jgi:hypothetical protein
MPVPGILARLLLLKPFGLKKMQLFNIFLEDFIEQPESNINRLA